MERTPFTPEGYERLKNELEHLERVERYQVIKAIEEARAHGDLSENAEYQAKRILRVVVNPSIKKMFSVQCLMLIMIIALPISAPH